MKYIYTETLPECVLKNVYRAKYDKSFGYIIKCNQADEAALILYFSDITPREYTERAGTIAAMLELHRMKFAYISKELFDLFIKNKRFVRNRR